MALQSCDVGGGQALVPPSTQKSNEKQKQIEDLFDSAMTKHVQLDCSNKGDFFFFFKLVFVQVNKV